MQKKKFDLLQQWTSYAQMGRIGKTIVNLSSKTPAKEMSTVLEKGLNFAITPRSVPIMEIICGVEAAVNDLPPTKAETV